MGERDAGHTSRLGQSRLRRFPPVAQTPPCRPILLIRKWRPDLARPLADRGKKTAAWASRFRWFEWTCSSGTSPVTMGIWISATAFRRPLLARTPITPANSATLVRITLIVPEPDRTSSRVREGRLRAAFPLRPDKPYHTLVPAVRCSSARQRGDDMPLDLPHRLFGEVPVDLQDDARLHVRVKRVAQVGQRARWGRDDERRAPRSRTRRSSASETRAANRCSSIPCQSVGSIALRRVVWA